MSHSPLRKETDCLNCGAIVQGRYCHVCGQENVEPKETFWHMFTHFLYDITHFDGSFFVTLKDLLFKPGFLSREYMLGRRKKYLHPVRMYVFTSAVFFLIFFSLFHISEDDISIKNPPTKVKDGFNTIKEQAYKNAKTKKDSLEIMNGLELLGYKDSTENESGNDTTFPDNDDEPGGLTFNLGRTTDYKTVKEYDSVQNSLPKNKKDARITKMMTRKSIALNEKYKGDETKMATELINKFLHSFPYLLFVSLPLYALFLKLLYIRHRKQYYFADHGVFLIHLYVFTFLFMLCFIGLNKLSDKTGWGFISIIEALLIITGLFYAVKAMKNFYRQGWGKTILKFIIFNILCIVSLVFLFIVFFSFSIYQI